MKQVYEFEWERDEFGNDSFSVLNGYSHKPGVVSVENDGYIIATLAIEADEMYDALMTALPQLKEAIEKAWAEELEAIAEWERECDAKA